MQFCSAIFTIGQLALESRLDATFQHNLRANEKHGRKLRILKNTSWLQNGWCYYDFGPETGSLLNSKFRSAILNARQFLKDLHSERSRPKYDSVFEIIRMTNMFRFKVIKIISENVIRRLLQFCRFPHRVLFSGQLISMVSC